MDNSTFWHLQEGNKDKQIQKVMDAVHSFLSSGKYKSDGSQGFDTDYVSAKEFVEIIRRELDKLSLEGEHDLHLSSTGSGKWYYILRGVWEKGALDGVFSSFSQASSFARTHGVTIVRSGEREWRVKR